MSEIERNKVLSIAQKRVYKHQYWFIGRQKTVFEAIKHFVITGDFILDYPKSFKFSQWLLYKSGYNGEKLHSLILRWLILNKHYDKLIIRFAGSEGGTDKGILKINTFIILKNKYLNKRKKKMNKNIEVEEIGVPKRDGSGRGQRLNRGRGGCNPPRDVNVSINYTRPNLRLFSGFGRRGFGFGRHNFGVRRRFRIMG